MPDPSTLSAATFLPAQPALWLLALAVVFALVALSQALACRRCLRRHRRMAAGWRALWLLVALVLALAFAGLGTGLLGYARMFGDAEVARLGVRQLGEQDYAVRLTRADGWHESFRVNGDQWQLDARVIRWTLPGSALGLPPLYRLERLSGRYIDIDQEREATRSVHALDRQAFPDLWTLKRQHPGWLPFVDADYGSAAYLPLLDGAQYRVSLNARGGLVAQAADPGTVALLEESGW